MYDLSAVCHRAVPALFSSRFGAIRAILALTFLFFGTWSPCNAGFYQVVSGYPQGGTGVGPPNSSGGSGTQPYTGSAGHYGGGGGGGRPGTNELNPSCWTLMRPVLLA